MKQDHIVLWEAHRGGGGGFEMPESCMASFEYGWLLGGRPEADVNETADGRIVSVHDRTLDRIIPDLPPELKGKEIHEISSVDLRTLSPGGSEFPGQRIPFLDDLLEKLQAGSSRHMVLDYKRVELPKLAALIARYRVAKQLTFASCEIEKCREIKRLLPEIRIKLWIGGSAAAIEQRFQLAASKYMELFDEIQLHLNDAESPDEESWRYQLSRRMIADALTETGKHGVLLQVLPWTFEKHDIFRILDLNVRSFAVDYPIRFLRACAEYFTMRREK